MNNSQLQLKKEIVYVDDDDDDLLILQDVFENIEDRKFNLKPYHTGHHLLNDLVKQTILPCLFIIDMNMPVLNGIDLIKLLKENPALSAIPIFVLSTGLTPTEKAACAEMEVLVLKKPKTIDELEGIAREILEHCGSL